MELLERVERVIATANEENRLLWGAAAFGTAALVVLQGDPFPGIMLAGIAIMAPRLVGAGVREKIFLISLLLRCGIMVVSTELYSLEWGIPVIYTGGDSETHFATAEKLTENFRWSNIWAPPLESAKTFAAGTYNFGPLVIFHTGYVFFLSLFGHASDLIHAHSKYTFLFADILIGSLVPVLTYDVAVKACKDPDVPARAGYLMAFYPMAIMLSGIFMKDSLATFLLLLIVKSLFYSERRGLLLAAFAWCWLTLVRYKSGVFLLPLFLFKWLFPKPAYSNWSEIVAELKTRRSVGTLLVLAVPIALASFKLNTISILFRMFVSTQEILERSSVQGLTLLIYGLPGPLKSLGMLCLSMVMPIPPWRSLMVQDKFFLYTLFSDLGAIFWYLCIPFVLIGIHVVVKRREHDIMIAVAFAYILASMALSFWIDDRRRLMALPFGFILCAIGYKARREYGYFLCGFLGLVLFAGLAYAAMKV